MSRDIVTGLTVQQVALVKSMLLQLKHELDFLVQLTAAERSAANAVAEGRLPFILAAEAASTNHAAEILLSATEADDLKRMVFDFKELSELLDLMNSIVEGLSDTTLLIGANAFEKGLIVRELVGLAIRRGIPGMESVYDNLSHLWENRGRGRTEGESTDGQ